MAGASVKVVNWPLGLAGGALGGLLGYFGFFYLADQGFYAMVLPGALVGLGCGALSGGQSNALGLVCGLASLALGVFTEWKFRPFNADEGLAFFLAHLNELKTLSLVLIGVGGLFGFWFGRGRLGGAWIRRTKPTSN